MDNQTPSRSPDDGTPRIPLLLVLRFLILTLFMLAILFLAAGKLDWWEAWAYSLSAVVILIGSRVIMIRKNPDMALERAQAAQQSNVKSWDRLLMPFTAIYGPLITLIVAGLDERFGWTPDLPDSVQIIALILISGGSLIGSWAMIVNRFFSSQVRIQTDRGQVVVSDGPYRIVRHPGYAGGLVAWFVTPFFFSSYWVAIPCALAMVASIVRTALEDRTLLEELSGYQAYAQKVRFRLVPGIW